MLREITFQNNALGMFLLEKARNKIHLISNTFLDLILEVCYMKKVVAIFLALLVVVSPIIYWFMTNPSNSLELMQTLRNSDNPESLYLNSKNIDYESIKYIQEEFSPNMISQFTLLEFDEKTYLIQTTPGTEKMKIIAIEELPVEIREYFLERE